MAILKCKMCGGDIELSADKTFGTCEFCGSTMTFPKVDDEQRAAAFNRGNHFRRIGEFDKALAVYERIVQEDENDAEAHWCCALCRFGIEYVEDPNTFEYLPTCHRASFDSFLEDVDYLAALEHSDGITKRQYQKDAAKIAEVQRGILATSQNEEPFDVFLCYKESENDGSRTRDSLYAQDIYYQLTEQGRRVFFSRITLEDKAGTEYEPYIFAALNSAKVMILVTTSAEHANAVWVKNEWSRFLSLMRKDRSKLLLPCYRDMDPYDLPEALSVLQSYDMSKIGFIQDLIRGVNKVLEGSKPKAATKETVVVQQQSGYAAPLLERAFMFLEDGDWAKADQFCEQVLNIEPKNALAYLGKLMAELKVRKREALKDCAAPFDNRNSYQKAIRFGDDTLKTELTGALSYIKERIAEEKRQAEEARKEGIYHQAQDAIARAQLAHSRAVNDVLHGRTSMYKEDAIIRDYRGAVTLFSSIRDYKDAADKAKECADIAGNLPKEFQYHQAAFLTGSGSEKDYRKAAELFSGISGYKDADVKARECLANAESARKESVYVSCKQVVLSGRSATFESLFKAIKGFESIADYRDSCALAEQCRDMAYSLLCRELETTADPEALQKTHDAFIGMGDYRDSAEKACECLTKAEDCGKQRIYTDAVKTMNGAGDSIEKLELAIRKFTPIAGWQNTDELTEMCRRRIKQIKAQEEAARMEAARKAEAERRAAAKKARTKKVLLVLAVVAALLIVSFAYWKIAYVPKQAYRQAYQLYITKQYEEAIAAFDALGSYKDSANQSKRIKEEVAAAELAKKIEEENAAAYAEAEKYLQAGEYDQAIAVFSGLRDYRDSNEKLAEARNAAAYAQAEELFKAGEYEAARQSFLTLGSYYDSAAKAVEAEEALLAQKYASAESLLKAKSYVNAYNAFIALGDYKDSSARAKTIKSEHPLAFVEVGDTILFGSYEQDNKTSNGKESIEWIVLKKEPGKIFVTSKYILDYQDYNKEYASVSWESSSIRKWLNETFVNAAFTNGEQSKILTVTIKEEGFAQSKDNTTQDRVFLLSRAEVLSLFSSAEERRCAPTAYAQAQGCRIKLGENSGWWWLRDLDDDKDGYKALYVRFDGAASYSYSVDNGIAKWIQDGKWYDPGGHGARPALWIKTTD